LRRRKREAATSLRVDLPDGNNKSVIRNVDIRILIQIGIPHNAPIEGCHHLKAKDISIPKSVAESRGRVLR